MDKDHISTEKIIALQGLRAVAFLAIFITHTGIDGSRGVLGAWGVSIFFALSGFLMIYSYYFKEKVPQAGFRFAWSKIKKLYLLHIVTMLFCVLLNYSYYGRGMGFKKTLIDVVLHAMLIQIWIPYSKYYVTLNGVSWYLCACMFIYLCFPILLKQVKRCKKIWHAVINMGLLFFYR